jgi:putative proteasome-type protease
MTYCLAIAVESGLVFASDSRTNAGVDQVSIYKKTHIFTPARNRFFVLLSAGNLGTTQAVIKQLENDLTQQATISLLTVADVGDAADYVGQVSLGIQQRFNNAMFDASFILGGQVGETSMEIRLIYPQGNHILPSTHRPFLQIGEVKYGKPILDRIITSETPINEAARCAIVSLDSTMRSNATVGPPLDITLYYKNTFSVGNSLHLTAEDPFYQQICSAWSDGIRSAFQHLPSFSWE